MRNWAVPSGALLILLTQTSDIDADATGVRIIATVFGFLIVVLALSGLNVILFNNAATGTWRQRLPSIFVDLVRIVLIGAGLAVLFSWVWGANVGGLFAALSVTSIVLGLALQNSVGSIIAGLLLLFEQPFQLGDWLDAGGVRGGWSRSTGGAVHIDTGNGTQIVPNASLAGASFTNLSRPTGSHTVAVDTKFAAQDDAGRSVVTARPRRGGVDRAAPGEPAHLGPRRSGRFPHVPLPAEPGRHRSRRGHVPAMDLVRVVVAPICTSTALRTGSPAPSWRRPSCGASPARCTCATTRSTPWRPDSGSSGTAPVR